MAGHTKGIDWVEGLIVGLIVGFMLGAILMIAYYKGALG